MEEKKSAQHGEDVTKQIFQLAIVGAGAGFFLASFEGYFRPPVVGSTRATLKEVFGIARRYSFLGAALFAGYATTEEVVVSFTGHRDWTAPFVAGNVTGLAASAVAKRPAWSSIVLGMACGIGAALTEGPIRDQMIFHQSKWLQLEDQEEISARHNLFIQKNREENNRRLIQVEREALQSLRE